MKKALKVTGLLLLSCTIANCSKYTVEAGEEGVLIEKPWFFGHGGVIEKSVNTGLTWTAITTDMVTYNIKPMRVKENFEDLTASDNVAIDFDAYLTVQIKKGFTPILHEQFGEYWYQHNLQDVFRKGVRNEARTRTSIELRTNEKSIDGVQKNIHSFIEDYIQESGIPIAITKVVIGKVVPPQEVLKEAERTAAQKQRLKTQEMVQKAEVARKGAESARASADKAYMIKMEITGDQYIKLKELEIIERKKDVTIYMGISPVAFKQF